jgi:Uma2 family endonuclease
MGESNALGASFMATVQLPQNPLTSGFPFQPMRISVARYHHWMSTGVFSDNQRLELLDGVIVEKMIKNPPHVLATSECVAQFNALVPPGWTVRSQDPITLARSEPEPDVAVVRGKRSDYATRHPTLGEIALVIEVSDSTLTTDRYKAGIYAAAGIPIYWIVNLPERVVEVYSSPTPGTDGQYGEQRIYQGNDEVPVVLEGQTIGNVRVSELLS